MTFIITFILSLASITYAQDYTDVKLDHANYVEAPLVPPTASEMENCFSNFDISDYDRPNPLGVTPIKLGYCTKIILKNASDVYATYTSETEPNVINVAPRFMDYKIGACHVKANIDRDLYQREKVSMELVVYCPINTTPEGFHDVLTQFPNAMGVHNNIKILTKIKHKKSVPAVKVNFQVPLDAEECLSNLREFRKDWIRGFTCTLSQAAMLKEVGKVAGIVVNDGLYDVPFELPTEILTPQISFELVKAEESETYSIEVSFTDLGDEYPQLSNEMKMEFKRAIKYMDVLKVGVWTKATVQTSYPKTSLDFYQRTVKSQPCIGEVMDTGSSVVCHNITLITDPKAAMYLPYPKYEDHDFVMNGKTFKMHVSVSAESPYGIPQEQSRGSVGHEFMLHYSEQEMTYEEAINAINFYVTENPTVSLLYMK